jgi:hypothetical protein
MLYSSLHRVALTLMLPPVAPEPQVLSVGTATASVTFTHPSAPAGVTYALVVTDDADNEVTPDSGSGLGPWVFPVADGRAYKATLTATAPSGQTSIAAVIVAVETADLTAPTPPANPSEAAAGTTSISLTWTHPGAPGGVSYTPSARNGVTGDTITASSGSGLGPYVFPASDGLILVATLGASLGTQASRSTPVVARVASTPALAWAIPAAVLVSAGSTSGVVNWPTPTGGTAPYSYSAAGFVADTEGAASTALLATAGAGAGATTVSGLVNAQTVVVQRTVTDSAGASITVQAAVTVASTAAGVTPGTAPAGQTLAAGTASATIGTWGAPSGGTGPYTYAVTEPGGTGVTIGGSGLGPWTVAGLSDGVTYAFLLTITDSLGAKGYSVVTISVAASSSMGTWEVIGETLYTDANWTALSSTDATIAAPQHTLYAADGTTVRALVRNNSAQARTLSIAPSGVGLQLVNGSAGASPSVGLWPVDWDTLRAGSRRNVHLLQVRATGYEPAGSGAFVHLLGFSTGSTAASPLMGIRVTNTGSNVLISAYSYFLSGSAAARTIIAGADRRWSVDMQLVIIDGGSRHRLYITPSPADGWAPPETGAIRATVGQNSAVFTLGDLATATNWFGTGQADRAALVPYHDGTNTTGAGIEITATRYLRLMNGSR